MVDTPIPQSQLIDLFARDTPPPLNFDAAPADDSLRSVANAARSLALLDASIAEAEASLEKMIADRTRLSMQVLPELLDTFGTDTVGLPDLGCDVVVEDFYRASIKVTDTPEFRDAAFAHLVELGGESLIKATLTVSFGKEDYPVAEKLLRLVNEYLRKIDMADTPSSLDMSVHWGLLTSFVRDWWETNRGVETTEGSNTPVMQPSLLGATIGRIARVIRRDGTTKPKKKRRK